MTSQPRELSYANQSMKVDGEMHEEESAYEENRRFERDKKWFYILLFFLMLFHVGMNLLTGTPSAPQRHYLSHRNANCIPPRQVD